MKAHDIHREFDVRVTAGLYNPVRIVAVETVRRFQLKGVYCHA